MPSLITSAVGASVLRACAFSKGSGGPTCELVRSLLCGGLPALERAATQPSGRSRSSTWKVLTSMPTAPSAWRSKIEPDAPLPNRRACPTDPSPPKQVLYGQVDTPGLHVRTSGDAIGQLEARRRRPIGSTVPPTPPLTTSSRRPPQPLASAARPCACGVSRRPGAGNGSAATVASPSTTGVAWGPPLDAGRCPACMRRVMRNNAFVAWRRSVRATERNAAKALVQTVHKETRR